MKNLICGARGWDPAVQEEKEEKDEEEKATLIKSRDPPPGRWETYSIDIPQ